MTVDGERVEVPIGPFRVYGSLEEWRKVLEQEAAEARPLSECPEIRAVPWEGELLDFPVTSSD